MRLDGSVGILTGASRGLGVYLAEFLARKNVSLALAARSADGLHATAARVERLGGRAIALPADMERPEDLERLVQRTTEELGPIDLLVNNAGIEQYAHFEKVDAGYITRIMTTNLIAAQILSNLVLPRMVERRRGHIVNIASTAGKTAVPFNTVYSASKHGLVGFSWSLREEMRADGVGVSVVCPGFVSDAGMFADKSRGRMPPRVAAPVRPEKVAAAMIKAIERNRAEIIVSGGLGKAVDVFHAISPAMTTGVARRTGLYDFLRSESDRGN